jgi:hypothetical protein
MPTKFLEFAWLALMHVGAAGEGAATPECASRSIAEVAMRAWHSIEATRSEWSFATDFARSRPYGRRFGTGLLLRLGDPDGTRLGQIIAVQHCFFDSPRNSIPFDQRASLSVSSRYRRNRKTPAFLFSQRQRN